MTIEERVRAAQMGDDESFYRLVSEDRERLYRIAVAYLKNEADALEAIQETTCRAYIKIGKLKQAKFFRTWLIRILINFCADEQKRKRKARTLSAALTHPVGELPAVDEKLRLEAAIERLEPKFQHVIILKYYQDLTLTEIALLLERPEGTVKTWLNKALKELRKSVGEEELYDYA